MIRDLFNAITANPDLVGQVRVMKDDIEPERLEAHETKLRRARAYLTERNLTVRPLRRTLTEGNTK